MRLLSAPFEDKAGVKMMQTGLWGQQVKHVRDIDHGESRTTEVHDDDIQSVLPLMGYLKERGSLGTVGGRCASMASLRSCMINSFFRPGSELARIDASTVVADANTYRASEFSQHTLARLLAMQLIGAGYSITSEVHFDHQNPQSQPLIGTPNGFQGYKLGGVLLHGVDTRPKKVQKITDFMQTVRGLARGLLRQHESTQGSESRLGASDQLAHRARLVLLAANPQRLQDNPDVVKPFVITLNRFERMGINGRYERGDMNTVAAALVPELQAAKRVLL